MDSLSLIFSNTLVAFLILIGIVTFIHELGHFLAGKWMGIHAEEFSIGFGPKIFSFRWKGTDFRLNWLPLGGYVRFLAFESREGVSEKDLARSVSHTKPFAKIFIFIAGPLANLILSFLIFIGICWFGYPKTDTVVSILKNSPAEKAGLQDGDRIVAIDQEETSDWSELAKKISSHFQELSLKVKRKEETVILTVQPNVLDGENFLGEKVRMAKIGVSPYFEPARLVSIQGSFIAALGLKTKDLILSINTKPIHYLYEVKTALNPYLTAANNLSLEIEREGQKIDFHFSKLDIAKILSQNKQKNQEINTFPLIISTDLLLKKTRPDAKTIDQYRFCGIKEGVALLSPTLLSRLDIGNQFEIWSQSLKLLPKDKLFSFSLNLIEENGSLKKVSCSVPGILKHDHLNRENLVLEFPFEFETNGMPLHSYKYKSTSFTDSIKDGFNLNLEQMGMVAEGIKKLLTGKIPVANLGGPISVANVAGDAAKAGFLIFIMTMALLSINFGLLNLVPIPGLDGGHILIGLIEAIYGRPLPEKTVAIIQRIATVLVLSLIVLVFYNDILRLLHGH